MRESEKEEREKEDHRSQRALLQSGSVTPQMRILWKWKLKNKISQWSEDTQIKGDTDSQINPNMSGSFH